MIGKRTGKIGIIILRNIFATALPVTLLFLLPEKGVLITLSLFLLSLLFSFPASFCSSWFSAPNWSSNASSSYEFCCDIGLRFLEGFLLFCHGLYESLLIFLGSAEFFEGILDFSFLSFGTLFLLKVLADGTKPCPNVLGDVGVVGTVGGGVEELEPLVLLVSVSLFVNLLVTGWANLLTGLKLLILFMALPTPLVKFWPTFELLTAEPTLDPILAPAAPPKAAPAAVAPPWTAVWARRWLEFVLFWLCAALLWTLLLWPLLLCPLLLLELELILPPPYNTYYFNIIFS